MDRQAPAAGAGVRLGRYIPCPSVSQPCRLSQVWMLGALPAAAAAALSVLTSLHAALFPPPRWLQGGAARPRVCPGLFLQRLPKQVVCWELGLKKQAVTTGLPPGAEWGADREPLRHCSCRYKFCYSPAFQCGFISKPGIFITLSLPVALTH